MNSLYNFDSNPLADTYGVKIFSPEEAFKVILMRTQKKGAGEEASVFTQHITVENTGRNTDGNGHSDGVSDGNEEYVIGN